jgi:hypothetical protein
MFSFLPILIFGCPATHDDSGSGVGCTEIAMSSVTVNVVDENGATVLGAEVLFSVDGGARQTCDAVADGEFVCGWEQAGIIEVTVAKEGYETLVESVEIGRTDDGCHVVGEVLTAVITSAACTDDAVVWGVNATLTGASAETLENPQVSWGYANADMEPIACEWSGDVWLCGEEATGDLEVYGTAAGHTTAMELVTVVADASGCHPVPQSVALVVQWGDD